MQDRAKMYVVTHKDFSSPVSMLLDGISADKDNWSQSSNQMCKIELSVAAVIKSPCNGHQISNIYTRC